MNDEQTTYPEEQRDQAHAAQTPKAEASSAGMPNGASRAGFPMEDVIGWILRLGVIASAVLIVAGVLLLFITRSTGYPGSLNDLPALLHYGSQRTSFFPTTPGDVFAGVAQFKPFALIALGLLVLIATPVLRVAASVVIFWLERDYAYVWITLFVLVVLLVSFLLGKAG